MSSLLVLGAMFLLEIDRPCVEQEVSHSMNAFSHTNLETSAQCNDHLGSMVSPLKFDAAK